MTAEYNQMKYRNKSKEHRFTDPIHITVFNCGQSCVEPFVRTTCKPSMELAEQLFTLTVRNTNLLKNGLGKNETMETYRAKRHAMIAEMKEIVCQMEYKWLAEWRCLFLGKVYEQSLESKINKKIEAAMSNKRLQGREMHVIKKVALGVCALKTEEIKKIVKSIIKNDPAAEKSLCKLLMEIRDELTQKGKLKRHPVILILDEALDLFPWEMMDICQNQPISRMPSLHLTFALYKEHEETIANGMKCIDDCKQGKYIVNPGMDLNKMEKRITSFLKYWLPSWGGIAGKKPTSEEFVQTLQECNIFIYNGHGSGVQYIGHTNVEKLRVESVVLLFGCQSVGLRSAGPNLERISSSYEYLIACSPCVLGMLWDVTDFSTDMLTSHFLSLWLEPDADAPAEADGGERNWAAVDHRKWEVEGVVAMKKSGRGARTERAHEPELLRALSLCRSDESMCSYLERAACVARGIPTCTPSAVANKKPS